MRREEEGGFVAMRGGLLHKRGRVILHFVHKRSRPDPAPVVA